MQMAEVEKYGEETYLDKAVRKVSEGLTFKLRPEKC